MQSTHLRIQVKSYQMRIGLGITAWAKGMSNRHLDGIGIYTYNLWRSLEAIGCNITGFQFGKYEPLGMDFSTNRICLKPEYQFHAAFSSITGLPFFYTTAIEDKVDIFHATDHHIPKLRRIPVIGTIMDAIPIAHPEWVSYSLKNLKNFALKRLARWCERVITPSEYSKRDIIKYFGIAPEKIDVIPLGVNRAFFERKTEDEIIRCLQKYNARPKSFIFVGTIQPRKNLRRLIEAHQNLPSYIQKEHPLMIIGKYGWGDEALRQKLRKLHESNRLLWLDDVPDTDLPTILQSAIAMVYPSLYEGFGLPVLEGFASKIPVICSNTTSLPEVAADAALLVDPESVDAIADAMKRVVEDSSMVHGLVQRGFERAKEFTWERCARQTLTVYHRVAG